MAIETLTFIVPGDPRPKGSTRAFVVKGHAVTTSATKGLKEWENRVALAAQTVAQGRVFYGPVIVRAHFFLTRPSSLPRRIVAHLTEPDLDKLTRAIGDALQTVLFRNDKQIVEWHVRKDYALADPLPRVMVQVRGETTP